MIFVFLLPLIIFSVLMVTWKFSCTPKIPTKQEMELELMESRARYEELKTVMSQAYTYPKSWADARIKYAGRIAYLTSKLHDLESDI